MSNIKSFLRVLLILVVVVTIAGYAYYRTKDFVQGPTIAILFPENGATVSDTLIEVVGEAKNISYISIDGRQIFTDEEGLFREKLLLYPGYNIISIKASDKFERYIEETLEIVYKSPEQEHNLSTSVDPPTNIGETGTTTTDVDTPLKSEELIN